MSDVRTRRVIEVQSDLYQKGGIEKAKQSAKQLSDKEFEKTMIEAKKAGKSIDEYLDEKIKPLTQYNDPTAHFRMVREEIKKAAQDGKTKLQFPTGETAMKIEGLGDTQMWNRMENGRYTGRGYEDSKLTIDTLKVGQEIAKSTEPSWIITDVLGDGKFKAVPKSVYDRALPSAFDQTPMVQDSLKETFDISGKVDTNNPIYKFYEKDVQKYLNKFGGKRVVDDKGVSWIEIPITKEQGKAPVEAFGKIKVGVLGTGAIISGAGVLGASYIKSKKDKK